VDFPQSRRLVKNKRGRDAEDRRHEQKLPFSDEDLQRMYDACENQYGKQPVNWSRTIHHHRIEREYARYNVKWTGQDLADFIFVSVYAGLRISDVATFHADRLQPTGEIRIRTTKSLVGCGCAQACQKCNSWHGSAASRATSWQRRAPEELRSSRDEDGPADVAALALHIKTNTALTGATYAIDGGHQSVAA